MKIKIFDSCTDMINASVQGDLYCIHLNICEIRGLTTTGQIPCYRYIGKFRDNFKRFVDIPKEYDKDIQIGDCYLFLRIIGKDRLSIPILNTTKKIVINAKVIDNHSHLF